MCKNCTMAVDPEGTCSCASCYGNDVTDSSCTDSPVDGGADATDADSPDPVSPNEVEEKGDVASIRGVRLGAYLVPAGALPSRGCEALAPPYHLSEFIS